jgi:glycosyltransferase involved in cell wall biosynthesis
VRALSGSRLRWVFRAPRVLGVPMRVLHIICGINPRQGGPTNALFGLAQAQRRAGMEVSIIATWRGEEEVIAAEKLRALEIPVRLVGPVRGMLARHPDLRSIVSAGVDRADIVHIHALWEEIQHVAASAAQARGIPYIVRPCGMLDPWSLHHHPIRKIIYLLWRLKRNLHRASAIHFTSGGECEAALPLKLRAPVIVEPLGIDLKEFGEPVPPGSFRRRWPILEDRPYVIFFGRICPEKGFDLLMPAFAQASRGRAALVIAGPDTEHYQASVERMIRAHGLKNDVVFTGMLKGEERVAALAEASLFVLPSRHENFGLAVAEAMAAGCPVIVSDQVNIHQEIQNAGAGAVVPLQVEALTKVLAQWLDDADLRKTASIRAKRFVGEHYDLDHIARGWSDHYEYLITSRRAERLNAPSANLIPQANAI